MGVGARDPHRVLLVDAGPPTAYAVAVADPGEVPAVAVAPPVPMARVVAAAVVRVRRRTGRRTHQDVSVAS